MSVVTQINGWIETDGYEREYNNKIMNELQHDNNFIKMFCTPEESGTKNPDFISFGASINFCVFEEWLEKFEGFIKKLKAFNAIVIVDSDSGDKAFVIGYELSREANGKFIKDEIDFGDTIQYCMDNKEDEFIFPLLFRILFTTAKQINLLEEKVEDYEIKLRRAEDDIQRIKSGNSPLYYLSPNQRY